MLESWVGRRQRHSTHVTNYGGAHFITPSMACIPTSLPCVFADSPSRSGKGPLGESGAQRASQPISRSASLLSSGPYLLRSTYCLALAICIIALDHSGPHGVAAQDASDVATEQDSTTSSDDGESSVLSTILQYLIIVVLVTASGLFSGLTLGLLGLDKIGLEIVSNGDDSKMAGYAKIIQPLRANGNLLLCTLLLGNVAVNAMLSIVMAELTSGLVGFFLATGIITIFGEIVPQAVCSRYALLIGSRVTPLVKVIVVILYPFTRPLAFLLDVVLGEEIGTIHSRTELRELLKIHVQHGALDVETGREVAGAMNYKELTVREVMTPVKDCFMLSVSEKLNFKMLSKIFKSGFSRIPVYAKDRNDVIGLLFTKDLIFIDPDDETPLENFIEIFGRSVTVVWPEYALGEVLKVFKQGKSHLGLVRDVNSEGEGDPFYEVLGIITLEDIIEEILGDEIVDETDTFVDVENKLPVERREFDMSRLRLLNAQADTVYLSRDEAKAVTSHLLANVPQVKGFKGLQRAEVEQVVAMTPVTHIKRESQEGTTTPSPADVLYRSGRTSAVCTLVLSGKVVVQAGKDEFQSDAGPWSMLAADAMVEEEGAYKPDFSAHVGSEILRCLRISKTSFDSMLSAGKMDDPDMDDSLRDPADVSHRRQRAGSRRWVTGGAGASQSEHRLASASSGRLRNATPSRARDMDASFRSRLSVATPSSRVSPPGEPGSSGVLKSKSGNELPQGFSPESPQGREGNDDDADSGTGT